MLCSFVRQTPSREVRTCSVQGSPGFLGTLIFELQFLLEDFIKDDVLRSNMLQSFCY